MKILCSLAFVALAAGAFAASAQDETGRVRALYVEAARGVLVEPRLQGNPDARRWADVELSNVLGERRRTLVLVPDDMTVRIGDLVGVQLAPEPRQVVSVAPLPS